MSKLDAQRAMRAARYDATHAASSTRSATRAGAASATPAARPAKAPAKSRAKSAAATPAAAASVPDEASPELCGHRSMAGKPCKRAAGHPETNHRYS